MTRSTVFIVLREPVVTEIAEEKKLVMVNSPVIKAIVEVPTIVAKT